MSARFTTEELIDAYDIELYMIGDAHRAFVTALHRGGVNPTLVAHHVRVSNPEAPFGDIDFPGVLVSFLHAFQGAFIHAQDTKFEHLVMESHLEFGWRQGIPKHQHFMWANLFGYLIIDFLTYSYQVLGDDHASHR